MKVIKFILLAALILGFCGMARAQDQLPAEPNYPNMYVRPMPGGSVFMSDKNVAIYKACEKMMGDYFKALRHVCLSQGIQTPEPPAMLPFGWEEIEIFVHPIDGPGLLFSPEQVQKRNDQINVIREYVEKLKRFILKPSI